LLWRKETCVLGSTSVNTVCGVGVLRCQMGGGGWVEQAVWGGVGAWGGRVWGGGYRRFRWKKKVRTWYQDKEEKQRGTGHETSIALNRRWGLIPLAGETAGEASNGRAYEGVVKRLLTISEVALAEIKQRNHERKALAKTACSCKSRTETGQNSTYLKLGRTRYGCSIRSG